MDVNRRRVAAGDLVAGVDGRLAPAASVIGASPSDGSSSNSSVGRAFTHRNAQPPQPSDLTASAAIAADHRGARRYRSAR